MPFALTQLTEPQQYASPTALPPGFDASIALLLGNFCNLTYTQLANGATTLGTAELQGLGLGIPLRSSRVSPSPSPSSRGRR